MPSKFLDVVHIDIAFGNCMSVGGFKYSLIFVDRATCYSWCFGLKSLRHDNIIEAILVFCAEVGNLARKFCCDCNEKLFESHICSFLHLECSSIVLSPAGRQLANGLVESHWKIMVHTSCTYLTKKQMPYSFWYYAIKYSARMMNMIPGNTAINLPLSSCRSMVCARIKELGFHYSRSATFITRKIATPSIPRTKPTP
jgi:hypothetical protein